MSKLTGSKCQCVVCNEVFSTEKNFDKHRKGDHEGGRYCVDPKSVNLELRSSQNGPYWVEPNKNKWW
jgi:hypothetical protein